MSDPRVFFAAERTLLAWVRSGLTMMAFGFVVARFGLILGLLPASNQSAGATHQFNWISSTLGIALVVLGAAVILGALFNHRLYVRTLPSEDIPQVVMPWLTSFLSVALALIGFFLATYLVFV
jgi:putative membrane protein